MLHGEPGSHKSPVGGFFAASCWQCLTQQRALTFGWSELLSVSKKAVGTASTSEQMTSASKNLGFAHRKFAYKEGSFPVRMRHLCISVGHLCNAFVFGAACKPHAWYAAPQLVTSLITQSPAMSMSLQPAIGALLMLHHSSPDDAPTLLRSVSVCLARGSGNLIVKLI